MNHLKIGGMIAVVAGILIAAAHDPASTAAPVPAAKADAAAELAAEWHPVIEGAEVKKVGGGPVPLKSGVGEKGGVATLTFTVRKTTFSKVWEFYAAKCKIEGMYKEQTRWDHTHVNAVAGTTTSLHNQQTIFGSDKETRWENGDMNTFTHRTKVGVVVVTIHPMLESEKAAGARGVITAVVPAGE